jgi:peptidyl-prolyl cis-trans isomerase C
MNGLTLAQSPQPASPNNQKPAAPAQAPMPLPPPAPAAPDQPSQPPRALVPSRPAAVMPPPAATSVAATVNGQPITEMAVYRSLRHVPADKQAQAREEIVKFLVDNTLLDQYLEQQQKIVVDPKDVDAKIQELRTEIQKQGSTFEKMMEEFVLTEPEVRKQIAAQIRWDRFVTAQATEEALRKLFDSERILFDGTLVRARHILLASPTGDAKAQASAKARLLEIKAAVQKAAGEKLAKLPAQTDSKAREEAKAKCLEETFGEFAAKESSCPSKVQGGNLGWFPFSSMVEPFAKVAFSLKPYELSDVVVTQFGYHLIMVTEHRPGKEPKFDEVKGEVREIYLERLRESLCTRLRQNASIVMNPAGKP